MAETISDYSQYQPRPDINSPQTLLIPNEVRFYLTRLADLADLKTHISRGEYPLEGYNGIPLQAGWIARETPEAQPFLFGKGLYYGVLVGIYGTRNILDRMGYGKEADLFLKLHGKQKEQDAGETVSNKDQDAD